MGGEYKATQLKLVGELVAEMGNVADKIGASDQEGVEKYMHLTQLFDDLTALSDFDRELLMKQAKEMDAEDYKVVNDAIVAKLQLGHAPTQQHIERVLRVAAKLILTLEEVYDLVKEIRG